MVVVKQLSQRSYLKRKMVTLLLLIEKERLFQDLILAVILMILQGLFACYFEIDKIRTKKARWSYFEEDEVERKLGPNS